MLPNFSLEGITRKRPGGPLVEFPIQNADGSWYFMGKNLDKTMQKDIDYYVEFWSKDHPDNLLQTMIENSKTAIAARTISVFVDKDGINTDEDRQKLSVYRVLIRSLGYEVGEYTFHKQSGVASAEITPHSSLK